MASQQSEKAAVKRANWSRWALAEVRSYLNFLVDIVNRSFLYNARMEKEGKITRGQIICFLLDHSYKMEKTWEHMQEMAVNMAKAGPEGLQIPATKELLTLVRSARVLEEAGPLDTPPARAEVPFNLIGTSDLASPMS